MAEYALSNAPYPGVNTPYQRGTLLPVVLTSNATTVSIDTARSASGFTITTGANGALTGTAPVGTRGVIMTQGFGVTADTIVLTVTSYDPVTGAFALQTHIDNVQAILPATAQAWLLFMIEGG